MNQEIKSLIDTHGIPPDGRLPPSAQRAAEGQREAHAQRARSRTRATAVAITAVVVGTAIFAAFSGAYASGAVALCAPATAPKGYTALCPIGQEKTPSGDGWPRPLVADAHPAIVFYECWAGGPIVSDPKECPPKEHGGYR